MDEGHSEVKGLAMVSLVLGHYTMLCPFPQAKTESKALVRKLLLPPQFLTLGEPRSEWASSCH